MASFAAALCALSLLALAESAPRVKRQAYQQQYPQYPGQQQQYPGQQQQYPGQQQQYPGQQQQYPGQQQQYPGQQQQYPGQQQQYPGQQQQYPGQQFGSFNCPQPDGQFAYTGDCSRFYQCDNGQATVADCQPQLVFNPTVGYCDWPHNVPSCPPRPNAQLIKTVIGDVCASNPAGGQPLQPFHVAHHLYCNAFFTCSTGYMFGLCAFCPNGTYFNRLAGGCRGLPSGIIDTTSICEGKTVVEDRMKAALSLGDDCWPFANLVNPWASLAQTIASGVNPVYNPSVNNPSVYNPPVYNRPYNSNNNNNNYNNDGNYNPYN